MIIDLLCLLLVHVMAAIATVAPSAAPTSTIDSYYISTLAGSGVSGSSLDGAVAQGSPIGSSFGVWTNDGVVYFSEYGNCKIRTVDSVGILGTLAGTGNSNGGGSSGDTATSVSLASPKGIWGNGNIVYVLDYSGNKVWSVSNGIITWFAGNGATSYLNNYPATASGLNTPYGIVGDTVNSIYISLYGECRLVKVSSNGIISSVSGTGSVVKSTDGGAASAAGLGTVRGISIDSVGNLFLYDGYYRIRKIANGIISTFVGTGTLGSSNDGQASTSTYIGSSGTSGLWIDSTNSLYYTDQSSNKAKRVWYPSNIVTSIAGTGSTGLTGNYGPATSATLTAPFGISGSTSSIFLVDFNYMIQELTTDVPPTPNPTVSSAPSILPSIIPTCSPSVIPTVVPSVMPSAKPTVIPSITPSLRPSGNPSIKPTSVPTYLLSPFYASVVAGNKVNSISEDGVTAIGSSITYSRGIWVDSNESIYFGEYSNYKVRSVDSAGILGTLAGTGSSGGPVSGRAATSVQLEPYAVWGRGNTIYIADSYNNRIWYVSNGVITLFAGNGGSTFTNNVAATSSGLLTPFGIVGDELGNVYSNILSSPRVIQVDPSGRITSIAGTGNSGSTTDGVPATANALNIPRCIGMDSAGSVYVYDDSYQIKKISDGFISTFAGTGSVGNPADGLAATSTQLVSSSNSCQGIWFDSISNLYFSAGGLFKVKRVTSTLGTVFTVAGSSTCCSDYGPATSAYLDPYSLFVVDSSVYVTDLSSFLVRALTTTSPPTPIPTASFRPTLTPSIKPSLAPSVKPTTLLPTVIPTLLPTVAPSIKPTLAPSLSPTLLPSRGPSLKPSCTPTVIPSLIPTIVPTLTPSCVPTRYPSLRPTVVPSYALNSFFISTFAGSGVNGDSEDGVVAQGSPLRTSFSVWVNTNEIVYIGETSNYKVRSVDNFGILGTLAGTGSASGGSSGDAATSVGMSPRGVGGSEDTVYVADNSASKVWSVNDGISRVFAGNGGSTYTNGIAATSSGVYTPVGLVIDTVGYVYFALSAGYRVVKVSVDGVVTTVAGSGTSGGSSVNVAPTSTLLGTLYCIAIDTSGNIYVFDSSIKIKKISTSISTFAGTGATGTSNDGLAATSTLIYGDTTNAIYGMWFDSVNNFYYSDGQAAKVKRVAYNSYNVFTVAGTGTNGFTGNYGPATSATIKFPVGIFGSTASTVYFCESGGAYMVRALTTSQPPTPNPSFSTTPTIGPSLKPTALPTVSPSVSRLPTLIPTRLPTVTPSLGPAVANSAAPSITPSCCPSTEPSIVPFSVLPSVGPTQIPTVFPSTWPSVSPTMVPSCSPSPEPSIVPSSVLPSIGPTQIPSVFPSLNPTEPPSITPSLVPSQDPSLLPSKFPTVFPSTWPSVSPTMAPSYSPSRLPTNLPTKKPSAVPSTTSTASPSQLPSLRPSNIPSLRPTVVPSRLPSVMPSKIPSMMPSIRPSRLPSERPTYTPSESPTLPPTESPSEKPTTAPSMLPSLDPSTLPSAVPSVMPSRSPSMVPSMMPSHLPSCIPTLVPSIVPSNAPSVTPTQAPTRTPSLRPTLEPSVHPTLVPSEMPSVHPTIAPTEIPTDRPTESPTQEPSLMPSMNPSIVPSVKPSYLPSVAPSRRPSLSPSIKPTPTPSVMPSARPSRDPTVLPSRLQTVLSSLKPTITPSMLPAIQPSLIPTVLPSTASPSTPPTTVEYYNSHPKATLPSNQSISVVGASQAFKIVVPYLALSAGPSADNAFSDIILADGDSSVVSYLAMGGDSLQSPMSLASAVQYTRAVISDTRKRSVSVLTDVNGDGFHDLIIGDGYSSRCYVMLGTEDGLIGMTKGFTIFGESEGDLMGWSVSGAGDVNNDTLADIIVGAPFVRGVGAVYIIYGRRFNNVDVYLSNLTASQGIALYGSQTSDYVGISVSSAGDTNGDGCDDVIFGAVLTSKFYSGAAYIVYGGKHLSTMSLGQLTATQGYRLSGVSFGYYGYTVCETGDVNKDGLDDVLIGSSPQKSSMIPTSYLIYGSKIVTGEVSLASLTSSQGVRITGGGVTLSYVGDVNRDGYDDIMVGGSLVSTTLHGFIVYSNVSHLSRVERQPSSVIPTMLPLFSPTRSPTRIPTRTTCRPSKWPSIRPTAPTEVPIIGPPSPTLSRSLEPTEDPSEEPTLLPTTAPSEAPTRLPSLQPTANPSLSPSVIPTLMPESLAPTLLTVTRSPRSYPTLLPSTASPSAASQAPTLFNLVTINHATVLVNLSRSHQYYLINTSDSVTVYNMMGFNKYIVQPFPGSRLTIVYLNESNDVIDLTGFPSITAFSHLLITEGSVVITLPYDQVIHILNQHPNSITETNFVFYKEPKVSPSESKVVHSVSIVVGCLIGVGGLVVVLIFILQVYSAVKRYKETKTRIESRFLLTIYNSNDLAKPTESPADVEAGLSGVTLAGKSISGSAVTASESKTLHQKKKLAMEVMQKIELQKSQKTRVVPARVVPASLQILAKEPNSSVRMTRVSARSLHNVKTVSVKPMGVKPNAE